MILIYITTQTTFGAASPRKPCLHAGWHPFSQSNRRVIWNNLSFHELPKDIWNNCWLGQVSNHKLSKWWKTILPSQSSECAPEHPHWWDEYNCEKSFYRLTVYGKEGKDVPLPPWTYPSLSLSPVTSRTVLKNLAPQRSCICVSDVSHWTDVSVWFNREIFSCLDAGKSSKTLYVSWRMKKPEVFQTSFSSALFFFFFLFAKKSGLFLRCAEGMRPVRWLFRLVV